MSYWSRGIDNLLHSFELRPTGRGTVGYSPICGAYDEDADTAVGNDLGECVACLEMEDERCSD